MTMVITRAPFRVSFFGGGTDIPDWFSKHGGQVLSTTIDKYCYVTVRHLPPFFEHRIRVAYSIVETCSDIDDVRHPLVREALRRHGVSDVEIHYDADLPARSGLGTSSSFAVGLSAALSALGGRLRSRHDLAWEAIRLEREVLAEHGGYQDQVAASFGGLNHIEFRRDGSFQVSPVPLAARERESLGSHLLLCYIPVKRVSSDVSLARDYRPDEYDRLLEFILGSVSAGIGMLSSGDMEGFGDLLHEAWMRKREIRGVTSALIDDTYARAREAGAWGGKILGAGGGGFMLLFAPPGNHEQVRRALDGDLIVPIALESAGTQVIYYDPHQVETTLQ